MAYLHQKPSVLPMRHVELSKSKNHISHQFQLISNQAIVTQLSRQTKSTFTRVEASNIDSISLNSLEVLVKSINRFITDNPDKSQNGSTSISKQSSKVVEFSASASGRHTVKEDVLCAAAGRGLTAYLSLPPEEYSLLDPRWITRDPGNTGGFILRVPPNNVLSGLGMELEPQLSLSVQIDPEHSTVHFLADQLRLGEPNLDRNFAFTMSARLQPQRAQPTTGVHLPAWLRGVAAPRSSAPVDQRENGRKEEELLPGEGRSEDVASALMDAKSENVKSVQSPPSAVLANNVVDATANKLADVSGGSKSAGPAAFPVHDASSVNGSTVEGASVGTSPDSHTTALVAASPSQAAHVPWFINCQVKVECKVAVPAPLSRAPGPLLSMAGGLVLRLVMQTLMPSFLELLGMDYKRWSLGMARTSPVGSLTMTGQAATADIATPQVQAQAVQSV